MDDPHFVIRQYFTSIDTSHGCPRILKTEPNSHTTIRRIAKIDLIATWMAPADSKWFLSANNLQRTDNETSECSVSIAGAVDVLFGIMISPVGDVESEVSSIPVLIAT